MYGPLQHYQALLQLSRGSGYGNASQMAPNPFGMPPQDMQTNPYVGSFPRQLDHLKRLMPKKQIGRDVRHLFNRPVYGRVAKPSMHLPTSGHLNLRK